MLISSIAYGAIEYQNMYFKKNVTIQAFNGPAKFSGGLITSGAIDLSNSDVTNVLPISKGGTSGSVFTSGGITFFDGAKITDSATNFSWNNSTKQLFSSGSVRTNSLILPGATSGSVTQTAPTSGAIYSVKWPNAQGGLSTFLSNDGSGNLSWATPGGGGGTAILCDLSVGPAETYTTITSAISASSNGQSVCVQTGTYPENVSVNKQISLYGSGRGAEISGSLTITSAGDYALVSQFKVDNGIAVSSGAINVQLLNFWNAAGKTISDQGTGSFIQGMQE